MSFLDTVREADATGEVAALYDRLRQGGPLPNWARLFSLKPEVHAGWTALLVSIKSGQNMRRYELATMGAARALKSSYCLLSHAAVLLGDGLAPAVVRDIGETGSSPALSAAERAVVDFAAKVASDATAITAGDIEALRREGLSDAEIFDVAATAAARCFFSTLLDALGAEPDRAYHALPGDLRAALTPGRPIEASPGPAIPA